MEYAQRLEIERIAAAVGEDEVGDITTWMYITCRLMAARGLLDFKGMSTRHGLPDYMVFHDPRTSDVFAVQRPAISGDAERLLIDRMMTLVRDLPN